jgi:predicted amidohydrolase
MKIAMITIRPHIANKNKNLEIMENYILNNDADLFIFGEMNLTGYRCKDELRDLAETIDGFSIKYLKNIAKKRKCCIVFGMPIINEEVKGVIHNAAIFIHPSGKVENYKKWFFPNFGPFEEKLFFDGGEKTEIINTKFGKIGLIICYDLFFPELCKAYSLQGADIIICISASPSITRKYFEPLLPARAIENTTFIIYTNLVGTQEDLIFWGGSQIYGPLGDLIVKSPYFKESMVSCDIDVDDIKIARANRPVIRDIRPEIFQDLYNYSRNHK